MSPLPWLCCFNHDGCLSIWSKVEVIAEHSFFRMFMTFELYWGFFCLKHNIISYRTLVSYLKLIIANTISQQKCWLIIFVIMVSRQQTFHKHVCCLDTIEVVMPSCSQSNALSSYNLDSFALLWYFYFLHVTC